MSTLYAQVSAQILEQIETGALRVGDRLPPEEEYAASLGISRSTLRLAFAELEASGVLLRKKRAGTEIIADKPRKRFSMATSDINELLSLGEDTRFTIRGMRTVQTGDIPQLAGLYSETGYWLEVSGVRYLSGEEAPFSVNRVYVPARFSAIRPLLEDEQTSVFRIIEKTFNVSVARVSQTVKAIACPKNDARLIGLPEGSPVLEIEAQLLLDDGALMEMSLATFDPERFQVSTDVKIE